jgi:hypothetical protein
MSEPKKTAKKTMKDFMPPVPVVEWPANKDERKEQWEGFKTNLGTFWDQMLEMQKTTVETWKEHWNKSFPLLMDMQDNLVSALPEEIPASSMTTKDFMDKVKDFQEMTNKHMVAQAENYFNFMIEGQQKIKAMVMEAVDSIKDDTAETADKPAEKSGNK